MALSNLKYESGGAVQETRGGAFIYDGAANRFHEWEFRTRWRKNATKAEDLPKAMNSIIESLRGDAVQVAMDIKEEELLKDTGIETMITAMRKHVFPQVRCEAKELYRSGHKTQGILSRQQGETMSSYVARRRRWWRQLKELDPSVSLSPEILGDLLLEASGLTSDQQTMVLTSTVNDRDFEKVAVAMCEQYPTVNRKVDDNSGRSNSGKGGSKGYRGKWSRQAHMAQEDEEDPSDEDLPALVDDSSDGKVYDEISDSECSDKDSVELDIITCMLAQGSLDDESDAIASIAQTEVVAYVAWGKAKGKGKGKKGKKGRRKWSSGIKPKLSLEERKKALAKLKEDTKCLDCGEKGHWAGDAPCKKKKKHGMLAVASSSCACAIPDIPSVEDVPSPSGFMLQDAQAVPVIQDELADDNWSWVAVCDSEALQAEASIDGLDEDSVEEGTVFVAQVIKKITKSVSFSD